MNPSQHILGHWFDSPGQAVVRPLPVSCGFSGARHWRVEFHERSFALRCWPSQFPSDRLGPIHALQSHLAAAGLPTPSPVPGLGGRTLLEHRRRCWELAPWMPGVADYWSDPHPSKLVAALATLARLHLVAASAPSSIQPDPRFVQPALHQRFDHLKQLRQGGLAELQRLVERLPAGAEAKQAHAIVSLAERLAPSEWEKARGWDGVVMPMQWCLRDVWHDHVLFTGAEVTGVIDFGAASWDTPAVDVARLLGSMVGDDSAAWQGGLAAYEGVRALSVEERQAIGFLDSSAVLLAPLNWIRWLYADRSPLPARNRHRALDRLGQLVLRMQALDARDR